MAKPLDMTGFSGDTIEVIKGLIPMNSLKMILTTDVEILGRAWYSLQYLNKTRWYHLLLSDGPAVFVEALAEEVCYWESMWPPTPDQRFGGLKQPPLKIRENFQNRFFTQSLCLGVRRGRRRSKYFLLGSRSRVWYILERVWFVAIWCWSVIESRRDRVKWRWLFINN